MRTAKVIGLGIFFSFVGLVILSVISIMRGPVSFETSHATGVSAMVGGLIEALFNPITWLASIARKFGIPGASALDQVCIRLLNDLGNQIHRNKKW